MASQTWQEELQYILAYLLNEDEVRRLCFDLGIDYDSLGGSSKLDQVAALVEFCRQQAIVSQLISALWTRHPDIVIDISDRYAPDTGSRARVELVLESDIISFGNQKRTELVQDVAALFGVEREEIHVLAESSGSTRLWLGMPGNDAQNLVLSCHLEDARFQALDKKYGLLKARLVGAEPGWPERMSHWETHRFRGMLRLALYLGGFAVLIMGGYVLAHLQSPGTPRGVLLVRGIAGALPGLIAWGALPFIIAKLIDILYDIGDGREAINYVLLSVFGPLRFRYPFIYVQEGKIDPRNPSLAQARPDGPGGPCTFIIFNDSAAVLERAGERVAIQGPSVYQAGRFVKIQQVLDLRPQTRTSPLALAITRDGIPVRTRIGATFRVRWRGEPTARFPYPTDPDALIQAATAGQSVIATAQGKSVGNWADRVGGTLESTLRTVVARYRLDELFEPRDPGMGARADFERNYREELQKSVGSFGAEITEIRIDPFEFDIDLPIKQQWIETWRASWEGRARIRGAQAEASAIRVRELAQAYAQVEMIAAITRGFEPISEGRSVPADLLVMRFIEVIRRMAATPEGAIFLPHEALQTLDGMRRMLEEARQEPTLTLKPAQNKPDNGSGNGSGTPQDPQPDQGPAPSTEPA